MPTTGEEVAAVEELPSDSSALYSDVEVGEVNDDPTAVDDLERGAPPKASATPPPSDVGLEEAMPAESLPAREQQPAEQQAPATSDDTQEDSRRQGTGTGWTPTAWEQKRFLDRTGITPGDILRGRVVFLHPGEKTGVFHSEVVSANAHLNQAKRLVSGDHFRRPQALLRSNSGSSTYTVQRGDTLESISRKIYGTHLRWLEIYFLNPKIEHHDSIQPGMEIVYLDAHAQVAENEMSAPEETVSHDAPTTSEEMSTPPSTPEVTTQMTTQSDAAQAAAVSMPTGATDLAVNTPPPPPPPAFKPVSNSSNRLVWIRLLVFLALGTVVAWGCWYWVKQRTHRRNRAVTLTEGFETYSEMMSKQKKDSSTDEKIG